MREEPKQTAYEIIQTQRLKDRLIYNGFSYNASYKKHDGMQSWRCTLRTFKGKVHKQGCSKI
jgi:hypothetical protein